jgi:uncharacterized protein (DUF1778 family)
MLPKGYHLSTRIKRQKQKALNVRVTDEIHELAARLAEHRQASVSTTVSQLIMEEARRLGLTTGATVRSKPGASA